MLAVAGSPSSSRRVLGAAYGGDVGVRGRPPRSSSSRAVDGRLAVGVNVTFPLAFVAERLRALPWIGVAALAVQVARSPGSASSSSSWTASRAGIATVSGLCRRLRSPWRRPRVCSCSSTTPSVIAAMRAGIERRRAVLVDDLARQSVDVGRVVGAGRGRSPCRRDRARLTSSRAYVSLPPETRGTSVRRLMPTCIRS